ncbi:MAG TPA: MBL fold metallo-hydrolase [Micropepsaceae bacterium]|nr:MBL fold metallo-hydrolase [Micropepsaceae bacterium]
MRTKRVLGFVAACLAAGLMLGGNFAAQSAFAADGKKEELSESYRGSKRNDQEYQKIAPFKLFDNLYYVGPGFVSAWLIPTSAGIIMIDTAQEPYVDHVVDSIKKSGFDIKDIKYIILSHGHLDHFGGAARIQELSGARLVALDEDWKMMEQFVTRPGKDGARPDVAPRRDMVVKEGDTLTLGNETLKFYKHPGHTPGSLSAEFTVYDNGTPHKAFLFGGPGPRNGVTGGQQFVDSMNRVAEIPGIEVAVNVHSWLTSYPYPNGGILERAIKLKARKPGEPNIFVDPEAWKQWVKMAQEGAAKNLEDEKRKAAAK